MVYQNILEAVGNTPMVELNRMTGPEDARVLVKYEGMNIGGSIKTRTALKMIEEAEKRGELSKDSIIAQKYSKPHTNRYRWNKHRQYKNNRKGFLKLYA
jgi:cysteine synthase A